MNNLRKYKKQEGLEKYIQNKPLYKINPAVKEKKQFFFSRQYMCGY
jgi:hypothetical protein